MTHGTLRAEGPVEWEPPYADESEMRLMMRKTGHGCITATMVLTLISAGHVSAQEPRPLPPAVSPEMVSQGKELFQGQALCFACHGAEGKGGTGPNLTDAALLHEIEDFETLVRLIALGINSGGSVTGQVMPPKGGSAISATEARAVAAYVWSISPDRPRNRRLPPSSRGR